jgi:hypothetical protein
MKRTVPLLITAIGGFVLLVSFFIPATETWGEAAAIWFDILASIAFILGGGNLLKVHLKKVSDQQAGWGYSAVTILAFFATLFIGLAKLGVEPAPNQEYFGQSFAPLPLSAIPVYRVDGTIPVKADGARIPRSVRGQLTQEQGQLAFRGWMHPSQKQDLLGFQDELAWQCAVERLAAAAVPPEPLRGRVAYYADEEALAFTGFMTDEEEAALRALLPDAQAAIEALAAASRRETSVPVQETPPNLAIPQDPPTFVALDAGRLSIRGPMTPALHERLARDWANFAPARAPLSADRQALRQELEQRGGPLTDDQVEVLDRVLDGGWTAEQLRDALNSAGVAQATPKTACALLTEKDAGETSLAVTIPPGENVELSAAQFALLQEFAADDNASVTDLLADLRAAGAFTVAQEEALATFLNGVPTRGEQYRTLAHELLKAGHLSSDQIDFLLTEFRTQHRWERDVQRLFQAAHVVKHPWSGEYNQQGSAFWWCYEYVFQPLTATMFALLAFYVASAAFRAFRAKNVEAILLLGTAFIILLGRTFAGVLLTSWLPETVAGLRVENLTIYIMSIFNTAGNRAIMIGIALGLASTSLRILLGVDRSHLGSGDE